MTVRTESVDVNFNFTLKKDMQEHEEICPTCKGLFFVVDNFRYGLRSEGEQINFRDPFPFVKQSLRQCPDCYWGVRKRCKYCNELVDRRWVECQCEKSLESRSKAPWQIEAKRWNDAEKISYEEANNKFEMLYLDNLDKYVYVNELADELQYYLDDNSDANIEEILNFHVYGTNAHSATFDARSILENATEELHEEAFERSDHILEKLQQKLDEIAKEISQDTTSYFPTYKIGVQLTSADIEQFGLQFE